MIVLHFCRLPAGAVCASRRQTSWRPRKWTSLGHFRGQNAGMPADCLVAALLVLQARDGITAEELAVELEVHVDGCARS